MRCTRGDRATSRLKSDLVPALLASCDGVLKSFDLRWHDDAALCVVMAAKGYPGSYTKGSVIEEALGEAVCVAILITHGDLDHLAGVAELRPVSL